MIISTENTGVQPILKATAPLASLDVTDTASEVDFRLGQIRMANTFHDFVKGHEYLGKITAKLDAPLVMVNVNGHQIQMAMEKDLPVGQQLQLRFMGATPNPSFLLLDSPKSSLTNPETHLSDAAQRITQYLRFTHSDTNTLGQQTSMVQQAQPVTTAPLLNPQQIAQDIKQSVSMSGLFYESHLASHAQGQRSIASILQEPHNAQPQQIAHLVPQQLQVLENNRFEWQGPIWQNQMMHMSIERLSSGQVHQRDDDHATSKLNEPVEHYESKLHLNLPKLGNINARLLLINGQLQLTLSAEQASTTQAMRLESHALTQAFADASDALKLTRLNIENHTIKHHADSRS